MRRKVPLIMRLPKGLIEQPAWVFIGFMLAFSGITFVTGYAESTVSRAIGEIGLRVWGAILTITGVLIVAAMIKGKASLEKLALRFMTCTLMAYSGYLLTLVPFKRAGLSAVLVVVLCVAAEFRVMHLKALMSRASTIAKELGMRDE